ncbi:hypothetical protein A9G24_04980 [Gilliamella sp. App6-5]|uniref:hypothetical protein n=1 Tax=Gilliamella sp. App6-5 TaxID=3120232 RepID=UPI00080EA344|nr:hypothetical protein [Gilliamella apicola]OCG16185.1 hypothetical protein A9G24_04980 [Gilliamella apicola]
MKLFERFIIICLLSLFDVNIAFSENLNSDLRDYHKIKLPYSSNELKKYYYWGEHGLYLSPNMPFPLRFTNKEFSFKPKLFEYLTKTTFYFPHCYFYHKNILYKGIIQIAVGENNEKIFTFQLYSYDKNGNLMDAILLYKIQNGEISYWNDFVIKTDGRIVIKQHQKQNLFELDEDPKDKKVYTTEDKYQMSSSGIFNTIKD